MKLLVTMVNLVKIGNWPPNMQKMQNLEDGLLINLFSASIWRKIWRVFTKNCDSKIGILLHCDTVPSKTNFRNFSVKALKNYCACILFHEFSVKTIEFFSIQSKSVKTKKFFSNFISKQRQFLRIFRETENKIWTTYLRKVISRIFQENDFN